MLLERTISQLDIGQITQERALELGHLGYMQWLGALPPIANYRKEAIHAYGMALPFANNSPAIKVFCDLLMQSTQDPIAPLELKLPSRQRRGGALARRGTS